MATTRKSFATSHISLAARNTIRCFGGHIGREHKTSRMKEVTFPEDTVVSQEGSTTVYTLTASNTVLIFNYSIGLQVRAVHGIVEQ